MPSPDLSAQPAPTFIQIGPEQGLAHREVYAAVRDDDGILWVGTPQGLQYWDGSGDLPPGLTADNSGLPVDWVVSLLSLGDSLMVGTLGGGLAVLDRTTRRIEPIHPAATCHPEGPADFGRVHDLSEAHSGSVLISTSLAGLWLYDETGLCPVKTETVGASTAISNVSVAVADTTGRIWIGTWSNGLYEAKLDGSVLRGLNPIDLPSSRIRDLATDDSGTVWIATSGAGVLRFQPDSGTVRQMSDLARSGRLPDNRANNLLVDRDLIWVGTYSGLSSFDVQSRDLATFQKEPGNPFSLCDDLVAGLYRDSLGTVWALTDNGACALLPDAGSMLLKLDQPILATADHDSLVWGLTASEVTSVAVPSGRLGPTHRLPAFSGLPLTPTTIFAFDDGLHVGLADRGVLTLRNGSFSHLEGARFSTRSFIPLGNEVRVLTLGQGALTLQGASATNDGSHQLRHLTTGTTESDSTYLVVPSSGGVFRIHSAHGSLGALRPWREAVLPLQFDQSDDLAVAPDGTIYAATHGGLVVILPETEDHRLYTRRHGLPPGQLIGVVHDSIRNTVWVLSDGAVSRLNPEGETWTTYRPAPGSDGGRFVPRTLMELNGHIVAAQERRLWMVNTETDPPGAPKPVLRLENSRVPLDSAARIRLPRGTYQFGANLTLADLTRPDEVWLTMDLAGHPSGVQEHRGTHMERVFRELAPRREPYRLSIHTLAANGQVTEADVLVKVSAPIPQTLWFRSGLAALLLAGLAVATFATVRKRRREATEIQDALAQSREDERKMLQRHLHDGPLQKMNTFRHLAETVHETGSEELLRNLQAQIDLTIDEIRRICANLRPSGLLTNALENTFRSYCANFQEDHPGFVVYYDPEPVGVLPEPAAVAAYRVLQSALGNVASHSGAREVSVALRREENRLFLSVHDDGKGFQPPASLLALARGRHFGILGMHEWARSVGGKLIVDSEPGTGTTITLTVPIVD